MNTYNYQLYSERKKLGLSRMKMAKAIGISSFRYRLIENGYLKPKDSDIPKISKAIGKDYSSYSDGACFNPCDLPEKDSLPIVQWFYELLGKAAFRIVFGVLTLLCVGFWMSGYIAENFVENNALSFYEEDFQALVTNLNANGVTKLSLLGDFQTPEVYEQIPAENGNYHYVSAHGFYSGSSVGDVTFESTYRTQECRIQFSASHSNYDTGKISVSVTSLYYETAARYLNVFVYDVNGTFIEGLVTPTVSISLMPQKVYDDAIQFASPFIEHQNALIQSKLGSDLTIGQVLMYEKTGHDNIYLNLVYGQLAPLAGVILTGASAFVLIYALFYGRKKGQPAPFTRSYVAVVDPPPLNKEPLKRDFRFGPFIPETALVFIGTVLVFLGTLRIAVMVGGFFTNTLGTFMTSSESTNYLSTFVIGMFLLYFIDFDTFMEDSRVIRNIVMYWIIFFCLYAIEVFLLDAAETISVFGSLVDKIPIPNMFSSIACYFTIIYCLFFTPKWAKARKWAMVLHRCLAILPIAFIFISWYLFRGDGIWFRLNWPRAVRQLFNCERLPFSVLAVTYLVGYYFIRLYYEVKLGETNANVFFNSNRFLWIKNSFVCIIILCVGLAELALSNNAVAHQLELGYFWPILLLIPLVLLYREHIGPRNRVWDWIVTAIYFLTLLVAYLIIIYIAALGLLSNMLSGMVN